MATPFKLTPEEQQVIEDRRALATGARGAGLGALKLGAAAADVGTLPVRAGMGAINTMLRVPNALGANLPYIPENWFGGSSSSMTPYMDRVRSAFPETPSPVAAAGTSPLPPAAAPVRGRPNELFTDRGYGAATPPAAQEEGASGSAPFTAADVRGTRIPEPGRGAFVNSRGEVTNLGSGVGAVPVPAPAADYGPAGNMIGAMMNQRRAAATGARDVATNKLLMEYALKAPGAQESASKAQIHTATLELARKAADNGATPAEVSAILANRAPASVTWTAPFGVQPMTQEAGKPPVYNVLSSRGELKAVSPTAIPQKINAANVDAALAGSMKGKSRAEVIQMYKNRGCDIAGVQ